MAILTVTDLTSANVDGKGIFDVLMRANKAHLDSEFLKNRIKGPEYATVYLGSLQSVMTASLSFLLQKDKTDLEAQLLTQQILLTSKQVDKANIELEILQANLLKIPAEINLLVAQTDVSRQQRVNLIAEALNIPKQGVLIDKQILDIIQKTINAVTEETVLVAQRCKLQVEFDVLVATKDKVIQETALLLHKTVTEKAQVTALGVDVDSVIGKQKALYGAQTNGFTRDAEQKAAKIMVDSWNVRRTTDEATFAGKDPNNPTAFDNLLSDKEIGRAVKKLLDGVGA